MKIKSFIAILLALCFTLGFTAGCTASEKPDSGKITLIATVFPIYDFARQICGDLAKVELLLPPGTESHTYEPSAKDMIAVSKCDLFLYGGGESEKWADTILESVGKVETFRMMDEVQLYEEELTEGMEPEEEEEEETEYDEHVWTSPANSIAIVKALIEKIVEIDPANEAAYRANGEAYLSELTALDEEFTSFFASLENKVMVFGDRFPLLYFAKEFGLECYAAFPGCSSETEPSAATVATLIDLVKENGVSTVFYIELSTHQIADTIAEATGAKTALFHTCHNVTSDEMAAGVTYLSLMKNNLETLKGALR